MSVKCLFFKQIMVLAGLSLSLVAVSSVTAQTDDKKYFLCQSVQGGNNGNTAVTVGVRGTPEKVTMQGYKFEMAVPLIAESFQSGRVASVGSDPRHIILRYSLFKRNFMNGFAPNEFAIDIRGLNFPVDGFAEPRDAVVAVFFPEGKYYQFRRTLKPVADNSKLQTVSTGSQNHIVQASTNPFNPQTEANLLYLTLRKHSSAQVSIFDAVTSEQLAVSKVIEPSIVAVETAVGQMIGIEKAKLQAGQCPEATINGVF